MHHLIFIRGLRGQSKNTHPEQVREFKYKRGKRGRAEHSVQLQRLMNNDPGSFTIS